MVPVLTFLRDHSQCQFKSVVDISGVDYPEREKRFEVVYHMLSISPSHPGRIRVKTYAGEADPVPSATAVFRGADWYVNWFDVRIHSDRLTGMREKHGICLESISKIILTCMPTHCHCLLHIIYIFFQPSDTYGLWQVLHVTVFTVANNTTIQALRATLSEKTSH